MKFQSVLYLLLTLAFVSGCKQFSQVGPYKSVYSPRRGAQSLTHEFTGYVHSEVRELVVFATREYRESDTLAYLVLARNRWRPASRSEDGISSTRERDNLINDGIAITPDESAQFISFLKQLPQQAAPNAQNSRDRQFLVVNGWDELRCSALDRENGMEFQLNLRSAFPAPVARTDSTQSSLPQLQQPTRKKPDVSAMPFNLTNLDRDWISNFESLLSHALAELKK